MISRRWSVLLLPLVWLTACSTSLSGPGESGPPDTVTSGPTNPGGEPTTPVDPVPGTAARTRRFADRLIGMDEPEAVTLAARQGFTTRVVERDGQQFPVTMDYSPSRINLSITDGTITAVSVG